MLAAKVAAGANHSIAVCRDGSAFSWGDNTRGQLGVGHHNAKEGRDSDNISADNKGLPGNIKNSFMPLRVQFSKGGRTRTRIKQIACGDLHTLAIDANNIAYSWGSNNKGQLGLADMKDRAFPCVIDSLQGVKIEHVDCGSFHSAASGNIGEAAQALLYMWGLNDKGQVGTDQVQGEDNKAILTTDSSSSSSSCIPGPVVVHLPLPAANKGPKTRVEAIIPSLGTSHTLILVTVVKDDEREKKRIRALNSINLDFKISNSQLDIKHKAVSQPIGNQEARTKKTNLLFVCGDNSKFQLGILDCNKGTYQTRLKHLPLAHFRDHSELVSPEKRSVLPASHNIKMVKGGGSCSLAVVSKRVISSKEEELLGEVEDAKEMLFVWGMPRGLLPNTLRASTPERVSDFEEYVLHATLASNEDGWVHSLRFEDLSVGKTHAVAVIKVNGNLRMFAWGDGSFGRLGIGDEIAASQLGDKLHRDVGALTAKSYNYGNKANGDNKSRNQLKGMLPQPVYTSKLSNHEEFEDNRGELLSSLQLCDSISCGDTHTLAINTKTGHVFSWGNALYGKLGIRTTGIGSISIPSPLGFFFKNKTDSYNGGLKSQAAVKTSDQQIENAEMLPLPLFSSSFAPLTPSQSSLAQFGKQQLLADDLRQSITSLEQSYRLMTFEICGHFDAREAKKMSLKSALKTRISRIKGLYHIDDGRDGGARKSEGKLEPAPFLSGFEETLNRLYLDPSRLAVLFKILHTEYGHKRRRSSDFGDRFHEPEKSFLELVFKVYDLTKEAGRLRFLVLFKMILEYLFNPLLSGMTGTDLLSRSTLAGEMYFLALSKGLSRATITATMSHVLASPLLSDEYFCGKAMTRDVCRRFTQGTIEVKDMSTLYEVVVHLKLRMRRLLSLITDDQHPKSRELVKRLFEGNRATTGTDEKNRQSSEEISTHHSTNRMQQDEGGMVMSGGCEWLLQIGHYCIEKRAKIMREEYITRRNLFGDFVARTKPDAKNTITKPKQRQQERSAREVSNDMKSDEDDIDVKSGEEEGDEEQNLGETSFEKARDIFVNTWRANMRTRFARATLKAIVDVAISTTSMRQTVSKFISKSMKNREEVKNEDHKEGTKTNPPFGAPVTIGMSGETELFVLHAIRGPAVLKRYLQIREQGPFVADGQENGETQIKDNESDIHFDDVKHAFKTENRRYSHQPELWKIFGEKDIFDTFDGDLAEDPLLDWACAYEDFKRFQNGHHRRMAKAKEDYTPESKLPSVKTLRPRLSSFMEMVTSRPKRHQRFIQEVFEGLLRDIVQIRTEESISQVALSGKVQSFIRKYFAHPDFSSEDPTSDFVSYNDGYNDEYQQRESTSQYLNDGVGGDGSENYVNANRGYRRRYHEDSFRMIPFYESRMQRLVWNSHCWLWHPLMPEVIGTSKRRLLTYIVKTRKAIYQKHHDVFRNIDHNMLLTPRHFEEQQAYTPIQFKKSHVFTPKLRKLGKVPRASAEAPNSISVPLASSSKHHWSQMVEDLIGNNDVNEGLFDAISGSEEESEEIRREIAPPDRYSGYSPSDAINNRKATNYSKGEHVVHIQTEECFLLYTVLNLEPVQKLMAKHAGRGGWMNLMYMLIRKKDNLQHQVVNNMLKEKGGKEMAATIAEEAETLERVIHLLEAIKNVSEYESGVVTLADWKKYYGRGYKFSGNSHRRGLQSTGDNNSLATENINVRRQNNRHSSSSIEELLDIAQLYEAVKHIELVRLTHLYLLRLIQATYTNVLAKKSQYLSIKSADKSLLERGFLAITGPWSYEEVRQKKKQKKALLLLQRRIWQNAKRVISRRGGSSARLNEPRMPPAKSPLHLQLQPIAVKTRSGAYEAVGYKKMLDMGVLARPPFDHSSACIPLECPQILLRLMFTGKDEADLRFLKDLSFLFLSTKRTDNFQMHFVLKSKGILLQRNHINLHDFRRHLSLLNIAKIRTQPIGAISSQPKAVTQGTPAPGQKPAVPVPFRTYVNKFSASNLPAVSEQPSANPLPGFIPQAHARRRGIQTVPYGTVFSQLNLELLERKDLSRSNRAQELEMQRILAASSAEHFFRPNNPRTPPKRQKQSSRWRNRRPKSAHPMAKNKHSANRQRARSPAGNSRIFVRRRQKKRMQELNNDSVIASHQQRCSINDIINFNNNNVSDSTKRRFGSSMVYKRATIFDKSEDADRTVHNVRDGDHRKRRSSYAGPSTASLVDAGTNTAKHEHLTRKEQQHLYKGYLYNFFDPIGSACPRRHRCVFVFDVEKLLKFMDALPTPAAGFINEIDLQDPRLFDALRH